MDITKLISKRFSCREFNEEEIREDELLTILEAGRLAPSARNHQPWRFLVLDGTDLEKVDGCTKCRYGAKTAILVCFNIDESSKNPKVTPDYGWIDCGIALTQMVLVAQSLGLATCIVGAYDSDSARRAFNLPENIIPYQFLMVGHAATDPGPMHFERKALDEIVVHGHF